MTTRVDIEIVDTNCTTEKVVVGLVWAGQMTQRHVLGAGAKVTFHIHGDCRVVAREATPADLADIADVMPAASA